MVRIGPGIGSRYLGIPFGGGRGVAEPELKYSGRSNLVWSEVNSDVSVNAQIFPSVGNFVSGNSDYLSGASSVNIGKKHTITIDMRLVTDVAVQVILGMSSSTSAFIHLLSNSIVYRINDTNYTVTYTITTSHRKIEFVRDGRDIEVFVDGTSRGERELAIEDNIDYVFDRIGRRTTGLHWHGEISRVLIDSEDQTSFDLVITGQGLYEYERVSGILFTWNGTSPHYAFSDHGTFMLNNGFSRYERVAYGDEFVPNGGTPPALYDLKSEHSGSVTGINKAPCLIGFNESSDADELLEIFDRSNTDRQENLSRESDYYDDTNLATKSRYFMDEILERENIESLFKEGHQNKIFPKNNNTLNPTIVDELWVYQNNKS